MEKTIHLPDVGDLDGVEVVEIFVQVGQRIEQEQTLLTLEGSKASMEIPSSAAGVVKEVLIKVGDVATESMALIVLTQSDKTSDDNLQASERPKNQAKTEDLAQSHSD